MVIFNAHPLYPSPLPPNTVFLLITSDNSQVSKVGVFLWMYPELKGESDFLLIAQWLIGTGVERLDTHTSDMNFRLATFWDAGPAGPKANAFVVLNPWEDAVASSCRQNETLGLCLNWKWLTLHSRYNKTDHGKFNGPWSAITELFMPSLPLPNSQLLCPKHCSLGHLQAAE